MIVERLVPGTLEWENGHHEHKQRYQFFADRYPGREVLDAACGVGYGSDIIARAGAAMVTGIDIAPEAVEYARNHYARPGVTFAQASAEKLADLGRAFDLVVSFETIEHLKGPRKFIRQVRQVLRPGGQFICSTPNKDFANKRPGDVNPYHYSEMTFPEFACAFKDEFDLQEWYHQSPSPAYQRHCALVSELRKITKAIRYSKLLALENRLRRFFGKEQWDPRGLADDLARGVPNDYVIEKFDDPMPSYYTYILVGRMKS